MWVGHLLPPLGTTPYAAGVSTSNPAIQPQKRYVWKKILKKTKIVQSAWCEVCKVNCKSKDVLDKPKLGKKHLKKSEPIIPTVAELTPPASVITSTSLPLPTPSTDIGPQDNPEKLKPKFKKSRTKSAARTEDLETKRRKVMEGEQQLMLFVPVIYAMWSAIVTQFSNITLLVKQHASMAKKQAARAGVASVGLFNTTSDYSFRTS